MWGWRAFGQWSQSEQGTEKQRPQHVRVLTAAGEVGRDVLGTRLGNEVPLQVLLKSEASCSGAGCLAQEWGIVFRVGRRLQAGEGSDEISLLEKSPGEGGEEWVLEVGGRLEFGDCLGDVVQRWG